MITTHSTKRTGSRHHKLSTIFSFCWLFVGMTSAVSQNTTIVFKAKPNTSIHIAKEIDNTYIHILTDTVYTDSAGTCTYSWDVNDYQFVSCSFYDGGSINFPILQGRRVTITHKGEWKYDYDGIDKQDYEFHNYRKGFNYDFLNSSYFFPVESGYEEYSLFIDNQFSILSNSIDSLAAVNMISPKFTEITRNDFNIFVAAIAPRYYRSKFLAEANKADSIKIEHKIEELFDRVRPLIDSGEIFKYTTFSVLLSNYFTTIYQKLDEKSKEELLSENTWVNFLKPSEIGFVVAPEEYQCKLLASEVLSNIENRDPRGNSEMLAYISKIRPQNPILPYLIEKHDELLEVLRTANNSGIKYIEDTINTFEDFSKVDDLSQKILYIDIWATWCGPCIGQFKHTDKVHELLLNYKNIIPVYISLDDDANDTHWREAIKAFNLNGYHLRSNKELDMYINNTLFEGKGIGDPRYCLVDKEGNILENELPYPGNTDELKTSIGSIF